ncbi:MAG: 23S rRNA (pseudouridine(1915)-N(3))-methyltransferase RlmH [Oscillospiraceae bacterium]|jgi:23S rRNA (pseudouridine1915-N3)-methyltransferase|nr:23S rRNA (pseudouridine(1915)-N(3))-methyltransferase RlmH [Oscillospiraceae bacterium]
MIGLTFICAGRVKEPYFRDAAAEYVKRLGAYRETRVIEFPEELGDTQSALKREAERITALIPRGAHVIALCVEGREMSSEELAAGLERVARTKSEIAVLIGSSNGLHDTVKALADERLSMSRMTLPHSLARVVALEQFYRAYSISAGGKYHK